MTIACAACGAENGADARFCQRCGKAIAARCTNCGQQLPTDARFCPSCSAPVASQTAGAQAGEPQQAPRPRPSPLTEERKLVTVLFADVTGSTGLGERLDPERLRALFQAYFDAMSAVIESWGGTVEKFVGDAVMAAFGVPVLREDDAQRALRAALEMLDRLDDLNRDFRQRHDVTLQMRIGVNTGEVIVPVNQPQASVQLAGDAVNVAARLEGLAEPGTVLVGERTYLATRGEFRFEPGTDLVVRGRREPVRAYRLAGAEPEAARGIPGLTSRMVGRERDLRALEAALDQAVESGRPHLVIVYGPAGIGKTRLTAEFLRQATEGRGCRVLRGRCLAYGHGITYWALAEILRAAFDIALDDPADTTRQKLDAGVRAILATVGADDPEIQITADALALTAGISVADSPLARMEPRAVGDELGRAWPRFATALTASAPTVLVLEDLHWAGDQLVEMVEHIVGRSTGPLLLVATARPEFAERHPGFAIGREDVTAIALRPLDGRDSERLIEGLLAIADLPETLRGEILAKGEGNPFFIEEIVRRLIDEGILFGDGDRWRARPGARAAALPDTVHALLSARIDSLPQTEKRVLQEASVVGRIFWEEPVRRSLANGAPTDALRALERKALVFARPISSIAGQTEYGFKHALVRDVAYASLPKTRRARAHAVVGDWISELAGDRADEFAELVAHHYHSAVTGDDADLAWADDAGGREAARRKAFDAAMAAGVVARRRYALGKAVELHEQALALAADESERADALTELGHDHSAAWHGDEAWAAYQSASDIRRRRSEGPALARLALELSRQARRAGTFRTRPDPHVAEAVINEGLAVVTEPEVRAALLAARGYRGLWLEAGRSDPVTTAERLAATAEAAEIADQLGNPRLQLEAEAARGNLHFLAGEFHLALESIRRQVQILPRIESSSERTSVLTDAAETVMLVAGDFEEALRFAEQSYAEAKALSAHEMMHATAEAIDASYVLGRWDVADLYVRRHLDAFRDEADRTCSAVMSGPPMGALLAAHRGDFTRARELLRLVGVDTNERVPAGDRGVLAAWISGRVLVLLGEAEAARALVERYLDRTPDSMRAPVALIEALVALGDWKRLEDALPRLRAVAAGNVEIAPTADRAQGYRMQAAGDLPGAEEAFRRALVRYEGLGMVFQTALTKEALAGVTAHEEARQLRRSALEVFERLGAEAHARRVREVGA